MTPEEVHKRGEGFCAAHNSHNISEIMKWYSDDVQMSEFGVGAISMDKEQATKFIEGMHSTCENLTLTTIKHYGSKEWSVWEYTLKFNHVTEIPGVPGEPDGSLRYMRGAALQWWNDRNAIYKEHAYANWVEEGATK